MCAISQLVSDLCNPIPVVEMCAISQLVSALCNPIPVVEHFRRSHPKCEQSVTDKAYK